MLIVYYNRAVFNKLEMDMAWQGRCVTLRFGGETIPPNSIKGLSIERKAIEMTADESGWAIFTGELTCTFRIKQLMKTKGKQSRTIAVWRRL